MQISTALRKPVCSKAKPTVAATTVLLRRRVHAPLCAGVWASDGPEKALANPFRHPAIQSDARPKRLAGPGEGVPGASLVLCVSTSQSPISDLIRIHATWSKL